MALEINRRNKEALVQFRIERGELRKIKEAAKGRNLSLSEYIRSRLLNSEVSQGKDEEVYLPAEDY